MGAVACAAVRRDGHGAFLEKVSFAVEFADETQAVSDAEPFLAAVRAHQDILAFRLAEARDTARLTRKETTVSMDRIETDPTWPVLILTAGPYSRACSTSGGSPGSGGCRRRAPGLAEDLDGRIPPGVL